MGIVIKQSFWSAFFSYTGIILGFVTTGILFPNYLTAEQIGILSLLVSYSSLLAIFANLGFQNVTIKLFPYFREDNNHNNGFVFLMLLVIIIGGILIFILYLSFKTYIAKTVGNIYFNQYIKYIPLLALFTLAFNSFDTYARSIYKSVVGVFLKDFLQRVFILISFIYFFVVVNFNNFVYFYIISLCIPTIIVLFYLLKEKQFNILPKLTFLTSSLRKEIISVGLFGILNGMGNMLVQRIDIIMISAFLTLESTGIYTISMFFGTIISTPSRSIMRISTSLLADAFKTNDIKLIDTLYHKSCINQFIIGLLLFIGLWVNETNIYQILPNNYIQGKYVIFFFSLSGLLNMLSGLSNMIIGTSPFYKKQTFFLIVFTISIVILNYILIPNFGITGGALASTISVVIYSIIRFSFLKRKYNLQPYNVNFLKVILIGAISYLIGRFFWTIEPFYIDIVIRSTITLILYTSLIYIFNISNDINSTINFIYKKILKFLISDNKKNNHE